METEHTVNPINLFWQSATVRKHLTNAGREIASAVLTGLAELRSASIVQDLPAQYPYLLSAFSTVQSALGGWVRRATGAATDDKDLADVTVVWSDDEDDDTAAPTPRAAKKPRTPAPRKKSTARRPARKTARR